MMTQRFDSVNLEYLSATAEADRYRPEDEQRVARYLAGIVILEELKTQLHQDFLHVDGALNLEQDPPAVKHVAATEGKTPFIHVFRNMVNRQIAPAGDVEGVWIPRRAYQPIEEQVVRQLPAGVALQGRLLGAAAVRFPYVLRPDGDPLDLPPIPAFQRLLRPGEEPFTPLRAQGSAAQDYCTVNVLQGVYGNENGQITDRIGLVWDERGVPLSINRQILARRAGNPLLVPAPAAVVERLASAL